MPENKNDRLFKFIFRRYRTRGCPPRARTASRGLGDWFVRALSVVGFRKDEIEQKIIDAAVDKAKEWLGDKAKEIIEKGASWAGTKALIWAIEQRLECQAGLYRWVDDTGAPGDLQAVRKADFDDWHPDKPILVFIHGTASSTLGSFGDLGETRSAREWDRLFDTYGRHIYAFEHRTFSESPIENALALARSLPAEAHLSVVTHSRGGLVGDLLCMDALGEGLAAGFTRNNEDLKLADEEDRKHLLELTGELAQKKFHIERYVRVASPAQGALLAGCHLDAFLSTLLHLIGLVPYLQASPAYAVAKRIILQIVKNRTDPRLVPGIEAMLPDSPLAALVGQAQPKEGAEIGVIAGDIEGGGLLKRIGVFLTDYIFFEEVDNDLVVDTDSMYGGLARERGHYLFDQGADVSHFRYFANARTRRALQAWLTDEKPRESRLFLPIKPEPKEKRVRAAAVGPQPVLIFLPGIMGSHLRLGDKDRVWFQFLDIAGGGMEKVRYNQPDIYPDGLFNRFYDALCDYLEESHEVHRFAYDWRRLLQDEADRLTFTVDQALNQTQKAVRIMAHSMGGLVVRMMIARHREVWNRLTEREGARFIMLGTPNRGSHLMVETLLGMSDTIRMLTVLDGKHRLQWWLDLVAEYPGALQLLPQPGFTDTAKSKHDYYDSRVWEDFKNINNDFWFGKKLGATPAADRLNQVKESWGALEEELPDIEKIVYVAGYGQRTPCGIELDQQGKRLRMIGTLNGDGSVTHASGLLDGLIQRQRVWYMDSDHGGLTGKEETFPALLELLERGETSRLPKTRPVVRGADETFRYEAGPVLYPTEQSLTRSLVGGRQPVQRRTRAKYTLSISCRAMDLRHAIHPILVGHYEGDPIAGAEAQIDRTLVNGGLNQRYHMGMYAGKPGTTTVTLPRPTEEQIQAGVQHGAIVIHLGHYGNLTAGRLGEAVRDGVLRYLLHLVDIEGGRLPEEMMPREVRLATLLLGYNSTTNISIADSVHAIVRGVMEANRQFAEAMESPLRVAHLELIELFLDVAISAVGAIRHVAGRLEREAESMGCHLEPALTLTIGDGAQQRLEAISGTSYWPRLTITDADRRDDICPPESRETMRLPSGLENILPPECIEKLSKYREAAPLLPTHPRRRSELARKLRFMYLSQRARAETVVHQRQPGLVETLVESSIQDSSYKPDLSHTLYQLLIPHDFKETARQTENLVLVVDGYTANLPWEMLAANDEPLIETRHLRRQLKDLLKKAPKDWQNLPEVLYACGRFYGELKDFAEAIRYLERAVAIEDKKGQVPVTAIEQLANFEARQGMYNNDIGLIYRAIDRLCYLVKAAGGVDAAGDIVGAAINSERCALLGSTYKRLAEQLKNWSMETDDPEKPEGIKQALTLSAKWYEAGEGDPQQPGFSPYNAQNRLALQAVLGIAKPEDAELARQAGKIAQTQYTTSRDFYDMIMAGDGELIAGIIDQSLMEAPKKDGEFDATRAIIDCDAALGDQLPKSLRQFDSVVTQIKLLKTFTEKRAKAETRDDLKLDNLAKNLGRIAAALDPSASSGANDAKAGSMRVDDEDKTPPGGGRKGSAKKAKPKAAPKTKAPRGGKRPKKLDR